ncbi:MAG TPA: SprT-like domain-containing protein [Polyangiales bacterium]|nr:SprT-like domain-containing protein [Polyangiales bacterium]
MLRAPHLATSAVVDAAGTDFARAVYALFQEFNARFFAGALAAPLVLITQANSARTLGDYAARDIHGLESRIRIAPASAKRGLLFTADVLLHEMVHAWQHEVDGETEAGYRGHGPRFAQKCNEIGAALGLPSVGVKGRAGLPDSAHWPLNVRPADYYPVPYRVPTRRAQAKAAAAVAQRAAEQAQAPGAGERVCALLSQLEDAALCALADAVMDELKRRGVASGREAR